MSGRVRRGLLVGLVMAGGGALGPSIVQTASAAGEAASFEAVARTAEVAPETDALAATFGEDCSKSRREIDRSRCRGMQTFVQEKMAQRLYTTVVDSPGVVSVSDYDAGAKGFRMRVVGCLTCEEPVDSPGVGKRFLTLKAPVKDAETMGAGVSLARPIMPFDSLEEARAWEATVKPNLRAEFVFRPAGSEWSYRQHKGIAFEPVAMRVFNRCTGDVVYSQPPSQGKVAVVEGLEGCGPGGDKTASVGRDPSKEGLADLPEKLGALEIGQALRLVREDVAACDTAFKMRGSVDLEFEVQGTGGTAQAVRAKGQLGGTDVAQCLLVAARKVQFPAFQQARQTFRYPVRLQGN
jgi:hypothetical protein